jgi:phospholipase B1
MRNVQTLVDTFGSSEASVEVEPISVAFSCNVTSSPSNPSSVHALRPSDIRVVGAIGDSMTAGFGAEATSLLNLIGDWRGDSWNMGGSKTFEQLPSLPNILRQFNPSLYGFSTGKGGAASSIACAS